MPQTQLPFQSVSDVFTCCCGLTDLRYGCIIIGVSCLIIDIIQSSLHIYDSFTYLPSSTAMVATRRFNITAFKIMSICGLIVLPCANIGLVYGSVKKIKCYLPPWVVIKCVQIFLALLSYFHFNHMYDRAIVEFCFQFGYICVIVYCCFVVCSYYRILLYPDVIEVHSVRYYLAPEGMGQIVVDSDLPSRSRKETQKPRRTRTS